MPCATTRPCDPHRSSSQLPLVIPEPFSVQRIAERQWRDYQAGVPGTWFAEPSCSMDLDGAYALQDAVTQLRLGAGDVAVGYKVGCTGPGTVGQFGMRGPISGRLFRSELRRSGAVVEARAYANLAIEGEMAVRIGPGGQPAAMLPVIELHNFVFRGRSKTLIELVANNGLHAGVVLAAAPWPMPVDGVPSPATMTVEVGDALMGEGSAWPHGDGPQPSITWLRDQLASRHLVLAPGDLVLVGTSLGLYPVQPGDLVTVAVDGKVAVECRVG